MEFVKKVQKLNQTADAFIGKSGTKDFHKVATDLLQSSDLSRAFDYEEIVTSFFQKNSISEQNFRHLEFSDLPLTVSRGEHCFIDLYFWRRRATVIHDHHFSGAFMCLLGKNIDHEFSFTKTSKIGKHHQLGKLELQKKRELTAGDVATIAPLGRFIHQNHHQADLTVNLCFRTPDIKEKSLSNYLYSGLRYEKHPELLGRSLYLRKFIDTNPFELEKIKLSSDDALCFLIQNYGTSSGNRLLQKTLRLLEKRMKDECGIDMGRMLKAHDLKMDAFEDEYE